MKTIRFFNEKTIKSKPLLAISGCLAGLKVRYDGKDKALTGLIPQLERYFHLKPLCPELEAGLGVPRPPVQLVQQDGALSALGVDRAIDVTTALIHTSLELSRQLKREQVCAWLLKARSPSCGYGTTPIHTPSRQPERLGNGLLVEACLHRVPGTLIRDEIGLGSSAALAHLRCAALVARDILYESDDADLPGLIAHYQPQFPEADLTLARHRPDLSHAIIVSLNPAHPPRISTPPENKNPA